MVWPCDVDLVLGSQHPLQRLHHTKRLVLMLVTETREPSLSIASQMQGYKESNRLHHTSVTDDPSQLQGGGFHDAAGPVLQPLSGKVLKHEMF